MVLEPPPSMFVARYAPMLSIRMASSSMVLPALPPAAAVDRHQPDRALVHSPTHVATTIKTHIGRTVVQWVTDARMATSRNLLSQSDANVEEVARRSGYKSPSHFQRSFKRAHGVSAGQWRSLQRGQG